MTGVRSGLQACRGDKHDEAVTPAAFDDVDSEARKNEVEVDACAIHTLPAGADFIMCYSVAEGENALRVHVTRTERCR